MEKLSTSINNNNNNNIGLPPSGSSLARTKSDQLVEKVATDFKSPPNSAAAAPKDAVSTSAGDAGGGGPLSRKSSRLLLSAASPGRSGGGGGGKNTHIRKCRSAQMKFELDEVSSGAALSRASSASLGLSFSFTGFTVPPDEIADCKPFSDDDIPEDLEAGLRKPKFQTEPTFPIYLKARKEIHDLDINYGNIRTWLAI